ncbi:MAG: hypothetical protein HY782_07135 [Chloroflexi bacterium]|nr:hypothetical protein [Chloroflexota bacterium]
MASPNPQIAEELKHAREQLAQLKQEKLRLFPPNTHPFTEPDKYPGGYTPQEIHQRNQLVSQIEILEQRIEHLQERLYSK